MDAVGYAKEFREKGYAVARGFFNKKEMDELIEAIKTSDPKAGQPSGLNKGNLLFYSNIFFKSQKLKDFLSQPRLVRFLRGVIGPDFWVRWDQAVYKGPGAPAFPWHQDNGYNGLKDEHYQLWIALSKMNAERGGLWLVPGSHKGGVLPHQSVGNHMVYVGPTENAICLEAEVGDVVLFSSLMLHYTSPNVSNHDRWAYVAEYMSLDHFDPYLEAPYFVVARDGNPQPEFVKYYRGRLNVGNQVKYLVPRLTRKAVRIKAFVGRRVKKLLGKA